MKKIIFAFFIMTQINLVNAEETKMYCESKCSPTHCAMHPMQAARCAEDRPGDFPKCYSKVPSSHLKEVNKAIETIRKGNAALQIN